MTIKIPCSVSILVICLIGGSEALALEKPKYTVLKKFETFEIRQYSSYLIAETETDASFENSGNIGFRRLFEYISGANINQTKIKMTSPVSQVEKEKNKFLVSFLIPSKYTIKSVPQPEDNRIVIRRIPPTTFAVIKYSGN